MTLLESIRQTLQVTEPWVENRGANWLNPGAASVRQVAQAMNDAAARFVTITAYQLPATDGFRLEYHWDLQGQILGFPFVIPGNPIDGAKVESIFDLCEAADWIEREVHEEYSIDFTGREYEPLLLRKGDKSGVNLREDPNAQPKPAATAPGQQEVAK